MNRHFSRWNLGLTFGIGGLAASLAAGCSDDFTDCNASRTCKSQSGGSGGEGGEGTSGKAGGAGSSAGGKSGAGGSVGESGHGGESQTGGSAGRGGSSAAGEAGNDTPEDAGGAAGVAGEAGAGGTPGPTGCSRDADCDDGDACNGEETCELEACVPGTPVECTNAEPDHCVATCKTVDGAAKCGHDGRDADEDGFKSAACTLNPGDDCDDDETTTHPGAAEMCDGVDSDCDMVVDHDEEEVEVDGRVTTLVAGSGVQKRIDEPNIAGRGEVGDSSSVTPFAIGWTDWKQGECPSVTSGTVTQSGAVAVVYDSGSCAANNSRIAPDVAVVPGMFSTYAARRVGPNGQVVLHTFIAGGPEIGVQTIAHSVSYKDNEYRVIALTGTATSNRVVRYGYDAALTETRHEEMDPPGEHIAIDGAHSEAIWTLRKSPTLDQVFASIGNELHTISDATTTASHPHMAWSSNHGIALAWRYGDGRMMFRHHQEACQEEIAHGFPGEIAATAKGFVLVSLSENKREIVANLIGPSCSIGPRAVLASLDEGSADAFGEPKVAVTGSQIRAVWTHTSGDHTDLESRLFSWADCE